MTTEYYYLDFNSSSFSSTTPTLPPPPTPLLTFPPAFHLLIYLAYNLIFLTAVSGNLLVIYVVVSSPRMRTVTNYLIANLALGDLLMALLCVPFSYISVLLQYWPFGELLCHIVSPAQAVCVFVSAYTLVVLAVDRYLAILYPLRLRLTRSQAVGVIGGVWVVAVITAAPIAAFTRLEMDETRGGGGLPLCEESAWSDDSLRLAYSLTLMILQYFLPICVLIFTYTRIALAVWGKKAPGEAEDNRDQRLARAKRKMIKMMLTVVVIYTVAWLPFNVLILLLSTLPPTHPIYTTVPPTTLAYTYFLTHFLAISHTVVNPIIYSSMNSRFREGFAVATKRVGWVSRMFWDGNGRGGGGGGGGGNRLERVGTVTTYSFGGCNNGQQQQQQQGGNNRSRIRRGSKVEESFI